MAMLRWHQRFENFKAALTLLEQGIQIVEATPGDDLIKAGLIQRFEITWELGWKVIRDYCADTGAPLDVANPINAIRAGFDIGLIDDGDSWVEAMRARNAMSHEYDTRKFAQTVAAIAHRFAPLLQQLKARLDVEYAKGN
jgi:nucleotidyltransferase substrate binding protein (TIGR01987 family)